MPRRLLNHRFWVRHRGTIAYLILALGVLIALWLVHTEANRGDRAHVALCAQRADLEQRIRQSEQFLRMTRAQRIRKFGVALGTIPETTIRSGIFNYQRTIQSYDALRC